ncbi:MAG: Maf family nucleotide pyrophosphatase [Bacteroidales bacterium]|nr:Maf family nucleotide pyrophosphatase [Bacteroidales bacterium]MCF8334111.1 Maf family nucleotide pyrophosphatase [Bacteroidales bacterium]
MIETLNPLLKNYRFILASQSPRRKALLQQFGLQFEVEVRPVDEDFPESATPAEAAEYIARKKGEAFPVKELEKNTMIITADTVVAIGNEILGKPFDYEHAREILESLSSRHHEVITAVSLKTRSRQQVFSVSTRVFFKNLNREEIDFYINAYQPYDKAGAYGIQEWIGFAAITRIEGSYFNVVGLPVHALYQKLLVWDAY